jgi:hypothetical protein
MPRPGLRLSSLCGRALVAALLCVAVGVCRGACRRAGEQLAAGVIESPDTSSLSAFDAPPLYRNDESCAWLLVAEPGMRVLLNFSRFVTEARYDVLTLTDGDTTRDPVRVSLPACLPASLRACLPACLPASLPPSL